MANETKFEWLHFYLQYRNAEDAKKALEQLNGFELAGRPMKVGNVTERAMDLQTGGQLDNDELDRAGIDLGATGRLALMAKLAEGKLQMYMQVPTSFLTGTLKLKNPVYCALELAQFCLLLCKTVILLEAELPGVG